ncbi:MAG: AEC family transporter [Archangium sp.]|nr:AEC family transporter [Archangium sp.]
MTNLLLLLLCFLLGVGARRSRAFPADSHRIVTAWVMFVSLPALTFRSIHGVTIDRTLLVGSVLLWFIFLLPAAFVWWRVKQGGSRELLGATLLCAGLSNTAFVGLPLIEALGGRESLGAASVVDQLGSFLSLFLFAIPFATVLGGASLSWRDSVKKLVRSPAIVALVLAIVLRDVEVPKSIDSVLERLADMMSPLALAIVGWQLELSALKGNGSRIATGLAWKLALAPAFVLLVLWLWRGSIGPTERIIVAQAAMAPMVTAGVIAADHKLAPGLAAALITVGVPLSLLTVPLWWRVLS